MDTPIIITKANGQSVPFDEHKLRRSLRRAHIPAEHHDALVAEVVDHLHDGTTTKDIYAHVNGFFSKTYPIGACRYGLKQAIMELGPSGYPFERYVGALLKHRGYDVQVGVIIPGSCVSHEVDVLAKKGSEHFMIECKFHNQPGTRSDVKVSLYVQARYLDIAQKWRAQEPVEEREEVHQAWLVTNTKCTSDALAYAACVGMRVIGWNYPERGNLQDMIESANLQPVTSLCSLSNSQKQYVLEKDIVLARDLGQAAGIIEELHLDATAEGQLREELKVMAL